MSGAEEDSASSPSSSSSEDEDPAKLTARYIRAQRQIWDAQNRDFGIGAKLSRRKDKRITRFLQKLDRIRRDPLFDEREAEIQWNASFLELQALHQDELRTAAAQRRKTKQAAANEVLEADPPPEEDDGDGVLGAMFGESDDPAPLSQSQPVTETSVRTLDFGKWSGLSPRRLLEELCKSHDPRCRIQIQPLTQTSHSAKHRLDISWTVDSLPEAQAIAALDKAVYAHAEERVWQLEMRDVAGPSVLQSEAYICALALSLISTLGASEMKATSRLPSVWRGLLKDLNEEKQKLIKEDQKTTLRRLQALIHENQERLKRRQIDTPVPNNRIVPIAGNRRPARLIPATRLGPEQIAQEWTARTARPSFRQMLQIREQLPVHQYKDLILSCIGENPVSIICAETGAGKSSGIPVLLLEEEFAGGRDCRILVTQPRRISAVTLARRVSQELGEARNDIGSPRSLVGYAIRLESKTSSATRITYATTGVLLRMLEESPDLDELDYLILDEVVCSLSLQHASDAFFGLFAGAHINAISQHERTMDLDVLFIALQKLQKRRDTLKIVLMSATVDAKKFSDYFGGAPVLDLPGRSECSPSRHTSQISPAVAPVYLNMELQR